MGQTGGFHLLDRLRRLSQKWPLQSEFAIQPADCLSACDRPCAVAFSAANKTTLVFGGLSPLQSAEALLKFGEQYHASADGLFPQSERSAALKKAILARIPPLPQD